MSFSDSLVGKHLASQAEGCELDPEFRFALLSQFAQVSNPQFGLFYLKPGMGRLWVELFLIVLKLQTEFNKIYQSEKFR